MMRFLRFAACALAGAIVSVGVSAAPVVAQQADQTNVAQSLDANGMPILLRADEVTHDQELGVIVARGDVEIAQGDRVLLADTLSFNQQAGTVTASGNIRLLEPTGEVIFAEYIELSDDMREGTIENLRILLSENARIAAAGGRRTNGNRTEMARGVYSPCEVCREDPTRDPLWQVRADRVIHDQAARQVEYYDAVMEFYGIPVAYTPYFTHPDPTVQRQSGFLAPSFGTSTNTGMFLRTPYFWNIATDRDATIDPILSEDQRGFFSAEYRQAYDTGYFDVSGSFTVADEDIGDNVIERTETDVFRGHFFSEGEFHADDTWRWGWDVNRSTDQTYLRKFSFWEDPGNSMTSTAYAEGFRGRNYMSARTNSYQDLRLGQRSDTELILPTLNYNGIGEVDSFGGRWSIDANFQSLYDGDDADSQRVSVEAGYRREFISDIGLVTTLSGSLRTDGYFVDQVGPTDDFGNNVEDGFTGRVIPRIGVQARYPFARYSTNGRQVIEPIVAAYASPNGGNHPDIPNADSRVFETDDVNLFSPSRTNGLDRVETGQRVIGGFQMAHFGNDGERISLFLGQSYRFREDNTLEEETGLESDQSDWVGRLSFNPMDYLSLNYRFNFQSDELLANRNELSFSAGGPGLQFSGNYTFVRDGLDVTSSEVEELSLGIASDIDDFWTVRASTLQDLTKDGGSLNHRAQFVYEDECFIFDANFIRSYTRSADLEEDDTIYFQLTFKTLGEVTF
ncbi:MAG: LPS assembly protein LptD [Alphaproteobacteria bacterium]